MPLYRLIIVKFIAIYDENNFSSNLKYNWSTKSEKSWIFQQKQGNFKTTTKELTKEQSGTIIYQAQVGELSKTTRKSKKFENINKRWKFKELRQELTKLRLKDPTLHTNTKDKQFIKWNRT